MIKFHNGYQFDFGSASGAMAFRGDGWWFEQPARWLGKLRPRDFTIITKTLTFFPRRGNLRWYAPWRCVRSYKNNSITNAVGLTNPGYHWWIDQPYIHTIKRGYRVIPSIMPSNVDEARRMADDFNRCKHIVGLQLNLSCPNIARNQNIKYACEITEAVLEITKHPLILKLSYDDDYVAICKELDGKLTAFELINSVPFHTVFPNDRSPLAKYGYVGGVSGKPISQFSIESLENVKNANIKTPIISGGGIESLEDVRERERLGADGFVFGSIFMRRPALPNQIIDSYRKH